MAIIFPASRLPLIYLISDGNLSDDNFAEQSNRFLKLVRAAVKAKIPLFQIREKQLSAKNLFSLTARAARITQNAETLLLVNDRADIALAAAADGVHLTANSLPAKIIRQNSSPNFIIGVSAHSLSEAQSSSEGGAANFATFSPIFSTPSKERYNLPPQGLEKLKEVCAAVPSFPVIALGGINETNFSPVLDAGAAGFAAIRFLSNPQNLAAIAEKIYDD